MKEWILPCSKNFFRIEDAFRDLKIIDWRQTNNTKNISEGDMVYIYISAPDSRIAYKGAVLKAGKPKNTIDDSAYTIPPGSITNGMCMELALFRVYDMEGLDINSLKINGLTSNLQCPITINAELANYLHLCDRLQLEKNRSIGIVPDVCLEPFPLKIDEGVVDINVSLSPYSISDDGKKVKCRNCGFEFMKAPRCTFCGQLIKYLSQDAGQENLKNDVFSLNEKLDVPVVNYELMLEKIGKCRTKKELKDVFYEFGLKSSTEATTTQNSNDLYFQFADGSRLLCQKTQFKLYTCPVATELYFNKYQFVNCSDGKYRTRKATVPKTKEDLEYVLRVFYKDPNNRVDISYT